MDITNTNYGRYVPIRLLGEGAMGRVVLAEDPVLQRRLAVKVIAIDKHLNTGSREEYLTRFTLEARASAKLNHPSIVTIHDAGEEEGTPWIAFEYVDGERLDDLLRREGQLPIDRAVAVTRDIASALAHAHEAGIVHRDIKPANILIDSRTRVAKLADFGIAKAPWTVLTQEGTMVGSPGYMSPEQIDGTPIDARSDLFSLGVVLYEMLTGKHPFLRETVAATLYATISQAYAPLDSIRPGIPPSVAEAVHLCLMVKRDDRIRSARYLLEVLSAPYHGNGQAADGSPAFNNVRPSVGSVVDRLIRTGGQKAGRMYRGALTVVQTTGLSETARRIASSVSTSHIAARIREALIRLSRQGIPGTRSVVNQLRGTLGLMVLAGLIGVLGLLVATPHLAIRSERNRIRRELRVAGYDGSARQAIEHCRTLVTAGSYREAEILARILAGYRATEAEGLIVLGRIGVKEREFEAAAAAFERALQARDGPSLVKNESADVLRDLQRELTRRDVSRTLLDFIVRVLSAGRHPVVKDWVRSEEYRLRWNAVKILKAAEAKVDMVDVYILDLRHSGSMSVRRRAVVNLGELGDKRAKPALEEAAVKGFRDPLVSAAARDVLERKFR